MPRATLTVEVLTEGVWLIINSREIREGMSEVEMANVVTEIADLKMAWETSGYFGASQIRMATKVHQLNQHGGYDV